MKYGLHMDYKPRILTGMHIQAGKIGMHKVSYVFFHATLDLLGEGVATRTSVKRRVCNNSWIGRVQQENFMMIELSQIGIGVHEK